MQYRWQCSWHGAAYALQAIDCACNLALTRAMLTYATPKRQYIARAIGSRDGVEAPPARHASVCLPRGKRPRLQSSSPSRRPEACTPITVLPAHPHGAYHHHTVLPAVLWAGMQCAEPARVAALPRLRPAYPFTGCLAALAWALRCVCMPCSPLRQPAPLGFRFQGLGARQMPHLRL
jgi:hypothetical protein